MSLIKEGALARLGSVFSSINVGKSGLVVSALFALLVIASPAGFASAAATVTTATTITNASALASTASTVGVSYAVNVSVARTTWNAATINGTVTVSDGTVSCTDTNPSPIGGTATTTNYSCNLTSTTASAKTITAKYAGNTTYITSTSAGASHTVNPIVKVDTTTTIASDTPDPSTVNTAYTVTADVKASTGTTRPSGTVTISDGTASCTDTTSSIVNGSNTTSAYSCSLTSTTVGAKTLTASYAGSTSFNTSSGTTAHTVKNAPGPACTLNVAGNLIQNPCLESASGNAPLDWQFIPFGTITATGAYPADTWRSGTGAAETSVTAVTAGGGADWAFDDVAVQGNKNYTFSAWYNSTAVTEFDAQYTVPNATAASDPSDCSAADAAATGFAFCYSQLAINVPSSNGAWQQYTVNIVPPADASAVSISQELSTVGTLYVDDYSLVQQTNPNAYSKGIVSLTFDDGWDSFYQNGKPILDTAGLKGTEYIITGPNGSALQGLNPSTVATPTIPAANGGYMDLYEIQQLQADGFEIGAHTRNHVDLTTVDSSTLTSEVSGSVTDLTTQGLNVTTFAYPEGAVNATVEAAVKAAPGIKAGRGITETLNDKTTDPYLLNAFEIFATTTPFGAGAERNRHGHLDQHLAYTLLPQGTA